MPAAESLSLDKTAIDGLADDVPALFDRLRGSGFEIGVDEAIASTQLLLSFNVQTELPSAQDVLDHLAPLLAANKEQLALFYDLARPWVAHHGFGMSADSGISRYVVPGDTRGSLVASTASTHRSNYTRPTACHGSGE